MTKWWQERVVYQIYPRSFQDSNGDGIGDIKGIISRLESLKELGIGILWLSPVYRSPDEDNGYDISDYKDIDPRYGTMEDMDALLAECKRLDIKLVMDLVINHTSDQHEWFQASRKKQDPYTDYYIWRKGNGKKLPNNWTSFFGEKCWEYDEERKEYYLHLFAKGQPDLNYNNPKIIEEIKDILRFWLDKGVSGFRCDVINVLYKTSLEDGKFRFILKGSEHYISQPGLHKILKELKADVLDNYDCFTVGETVFVTTEMAKELCYDELNMLFSFAHMDTDHYIVKWFKRRFHAGRFGNVIAKWQNALEWNANYLENHDQPRSVSRFGNDTEYWEKSSKLLCTMLLTLRGTPYIFQGQEIGMTNFDYKDMEDVEDVESHNIYRLAKKLHIPKRYRWRMIQKASRDNARTPMQWNSDKNAGFTKGTPWLKVNDNYSRINVDSQVNDAGSIRSYYKNMIALRSGSDVLKQGIFKLIKATKHLFIYERELDGRRLKILLNFSKQTQKVPCEGRIMISNYYRTEYDGLLQPYESIVLEVGND